MHLPVTYIRIFIGALDLDAARRREILRAARIRARDIEGADRYVDFALVDRLLAAIDERLPAGWHIDVAGRMDVAHHGALGIAAITAPTLGGALDLLSKFGEVRGPYAWSEVRAGRDPVQVRYHELVHLGHLRHILMETMQISGVQIIRHIMGRSDPALTLSLPADREGEAASLARVCRCSLRFEGDQYLTELPRDWLRQPCLLYEEAMHKVSLARCEELLQQVAKRSALEVEVRGHLVAAGGRSPGLESVAAALNMSRRTLIRRLKREGTSFQRILDEVHRSLAHEYLASTRLGIADIGYRLGYQDPANFGRAFRRWYGMAPGEYRRSVGGGV